MVVVVVAVVVVAIDLRDLTSDEIYDMLAPDIKEFFTTFPSEPTEDKALRVTRVLASWKMYMDEVARQQSACKRFEDMENSKKNEKKDMGKWAAQHEKVVEFGRKVRHLEHDKVFEKHDTMTAIIADRKKRKIEEVSKASGSSSSEWKKAAMEVRRFGAVIGQAASRVLTKHMQVNDDNEGEQDSGKS